MKKLFLLCSPWDRFTLFKDNYLNYKKHTFLWLEPQKLPTISVCALENVSGLTNPNARDSFSTYTLWIIFLFVIGVFL
jgi:hypothetical protein